MRQVDAEARLAKIHRRVGELLDSVGERMPIKGLVNARITRINIRTQTETDPGVLLVIKATGEQGDHIAFVGGLDIIQALLSWRAKEAGPGLRWREDVPWTER